MANPIEIFQTKVTTAADALALINGVFQWAFGPNEPSITFPFLNWADTGNDLWKQRNADDNGWIVRGKLSEAYFGLATDPLGHVKEYYGSTLPPRHLWANGCTIGDAQSNATGRANADVFDLYEVLWPAVNNDYSQIKIYNSDGVLTEKGASAAVDFAAHKAISLPDKRGRVGIGLDNMGGTSANVVTNNNADILGGAGGEEKHALIADENGPHTHNIKWGQGAGISGATGGSSYVTQDYYTILPDYAMTSGLGTPHNNMQPWVACNYIMRY